jgi:hypothetical protein
MGNKKAVVINFDKKLRNLKSTDFDGHTDFIKFSAEQKLLWLSNTAQFWFLTRKKCLIPKRMRAGKGTSLMSIVLNKNRKASRAL